MCEIVFISYRIDIY